MYRCNGNISVINSLKVREMPFGLHPSKLRESYPIVLFTSSSKRMARLIVGRLDFLQNVENSAATDLYTNSSSDEIMYILY